MGEVTAVNRPPKGAGFPREATDPDYRALFGLTKDAIFVANAESGMIVDANPEAEELIGRPLAEIQKLHHSQLYPSDEAEEARREFARVVQQPGAFRNVQSIRKWSVVHRDGRTIPVDIVTSLWTGREGTTMVFGIFRDVSEPRRSADALGRSEEGLRQIAELAGEFIWEVDGEGLYTYASPVVEQILGYTPEELVGRKHFWDFFVPERREEMKHAAFAVIGRRERFRGVPNLKMRKDGTIVALETSGLPTYDTSGAFVGYRGADRDVTERQRAEQASRDSRSRFRALFENSLDAVLLTHTDGSVEAANAAACAMFNMTEQEICKAGRAGLVVHDERLSAALEIRRLRGHVQTELTHLRKDGTRFDSDFSSVVLGEGQGAFVIIRDITARKAVEEALRESEQRLRLATEAAKIGAFDWNIQTGVNAWTPKLEAIYGLAPGEFERTQSAWEQLVHPSDLAGALAKVEETLATGEPVEHEWRVVWHDGSVHWVTGLFQAFKDAAGKPLRVTGVNIDITAHKAEEEALRESEQRFRSLFENATVGIYRTTPAGRIEMANLALLRMLGYESFADLSQRNLESGFETEHSRSDFRKIVEQQGAISGCETVWTRKDGSILFVRESAWCVRDEAGAVRYYEGIVEDVTDRKRMEDALRESEQKFATAFRLGPAAMSIVDVENGNRILDMNEGFEQATGYCRGELVGRSATELGLWPQVEESEPGERRFGMDARLRNFEFQFRKKTGEIRAGLISAEPMETNNRRYAITCTIDITDRKQAEAALSESEERFRNMADTAPVMIWVSGPDHLGTFFNKAWLDFTGRTMEQELGEGWISSVHPDDLNHCLTRCGGAFAARRAFQIEFRLRRADGKYRWILDSGVPRYRNGEFIGFIGSCLDLTERKLVEERLRASEAQLTEAQRLAKVGSSEVDINGGRGYWSDEMFRILGLPADAEPGLSSFLSRVHPNDREIVHEAWGKASSSTAPVQAEFRIIRPDGDVRFVRSVVESIQDERGAPVRLRGATQDITAQVSATERLRESEKRLSNAERIAHVGNWRWEIESKRVHWSEELCRIFGCTEDGPHSYEGFIQLVVPEDRERVVQWVRDRLSGKGESSLEFQIARPSGELRIVACVIEVTLDGQGLPAQVSGTCQDVTDARRAQAESFARQKLESLGTLASGIAHDFNNLLGGVLAQAELADAELAAGSSPQQELKEIRDAAVRGSEIVRQLMIYAGKESDVVEPVDISRTVEEMLGLVKASLSKHATLLTDLRDDLPAVKARAAQIRQILMNLVVNASDAIKDRDGVIRVATGRITVDRDLAATLPEELAEGDYVQLEVTDTGSGMSQATLARMFDPFFSTKSAGRGLGLTVVHGNVRSLGGAIWVSSEVGKGTTFQILLPSANTPALGPSDKHQGNSQALRASSKSTVLVVEDEALLRQAVSKMMGKAGFTVFEAEDGSEAIELLRATGVEIDVLLLDVTIPGRPSHDVLAEAVLARPDVKVILTSAYSEEMVRETLNGSQFHGFVRKPFQLATVVLAVRNALL
jgi:PAS domain S-box-containing protein